MSDHTLPSKRGGTRGYLAVAFFAGLVGFVLGNAFWFLASPLWIDVEVNEQFVETAVDERLAAGSFVDADSRHKGSGNAAIIRQTDGSHVVRFTNFEVTNGPDLKVWLVAHPNPQSKADVLDNDWVTLGPLRGNIGDQTYDIPAGTDLSKYGSIVIWCEAFSVLFSTAAFN
jgi:hypothetical protein